jgi:hypothetical protein
MCIFAGIQIDHETQVPTAPAQALVDRYEELVRMADDTNNKYIQPDLPLQESYSLPTTGILSLPSLSF